VNSDVFLSDAVPAEAKQPEHPGLDSASESGDDDDMPGTEDEGEANMHVEDERKLMRSVLSQFDDGATAAGEQTAKPPAAVRASLSGCHCAAAYGASEQMCCGLDSRREPDCICVAQRKPLPSSFTMICYARDK